MVLKTGFLGWASLLFTVTLVNAQEIEGKPDPLVQVGPKSPSWTSPRLPVPDTASAAADLDFIPGRNPAGGLKFPDARRSVGLLVAQLATSFEPPSQPVPFESVTAGPNLSPSDATGPAAGELSANTDKPGWTIPPIRWGGSVSSNVNSTSSDFSQSHSNAQILSLRGASYIYQPWYAQVSGHVGLLSGASSSFSEGSDSDNSSRSTAVNYGADLSLFPVSRFPFKAYVQQSDSRADANTIGIQYSTSRLGVAQSWRPETGNERVSASFDRSNIATNSLSSTVDALRGSYSTEMDQHSLNGTVNYSKSTGDIGGQGSNLLNLHGSHFWNNWEEGLSVSSFANISDNQTRLQNGNSLTNLNNQLLQLGNNVTWRPDEDLPLTINGGVNMTTSATTTDTETTNFFNVNAFANTYYRFTNNLSASGGFILLHSRSADRYVSAFGQNGALTYTGNPVVFGSSFYNWSTGVAVVNQNTTTGADFSSVTSNTQHGLSRSVPFSERSMLTLNASQALSLSNSNTSGANGFATSGANLSHTLGATWFSHNGEGESSTLSGTFSDSMSLVGERNHYRNLSAYGNFQSQLSRRSLLVFNLNINASQLMSSPAVDAGQQSADPIWSGAAGASYSLRNPFDVRNMTYVATIRNNYNQTNLRVASGDPNALAWQTGMFFQQSLDYRIGRLSFRTSHTIAENIGVRVVSIYGVITRYFGDY